MIKLEAIINQLNKHSKKKSTSQIGLKSQEKKCICELFPVQTNDLDCERFRHQTVNYHLFIMFLKLISS